MLYKSFEWKFIPAINLRRNITAKCTKNDLIGNFVGSAIDVDLIRLILWSIRLISLKTRRNEKKRGVKSILLFWTILFSVGSWWWLHSSAWESVGEPVYLRFINYRNWVPRPIYAHHLWLVKIMNIDGEKEKNNNSKKKTLRHTQHVEYHKS